MPGRHTTTRRPSRAGPILAAAVAVAVIVALGIYLAPRLTASSDASECDDEQQVSIAVPIDLTPSIRAAVEAMSRSDSSDACIDLSVNTVYPDSSMSQINGNANTTPTVWILDSKARMALLEPKARNQVRVMGSAATTPILLGASRNASHTPPPSWSAAFEHEDFVLPEPARHSAGAFALAALSADNDGADIAPVLEEVAARQADAEDPVPHTKVLVRESHREFGPVRWFPVTEQEWVTFRMRRVNWDLTAFLPKSGTTVLNYPVVTRTDSEVATQAAEQLLEFLGSSAGSAHLGDRGFRAANGELLNAASLDEKFEVLPAPSNLDELLTAWGDAQAAVR